MKRLLADVDRLLRGGFTRVEDLRAGRIEVPVRTLVIASLVLGGAYGLFMGLYAAVRGDSDGALQILATLFKVPLLFLLTLGVTFPSLYVFSALSNSRLRSLDTLRLLLIAVSVNLALLASLGPVTGFFTLSTESYPFMVLLNVAFFAVSGYAGLTFLRRALRAVFDSSGEESLPRTAPPAPVSADDEDGSAGAAAQAMVVASTDAVERLVEAREEAAARKSRSRRVFNTWTLIYAVVGAQTGWILRPFVGTPGQPFELFRDRESHFFASVWGTLVRLFS